MRHTDIYSLINSERENWKLPIVVQENFEWNAYEHVRVSTLYKNSRYASGKADRPFKNIIRPFLNLQYRAEGFDVKDILLYIDNAVQYYKSVILRKFHERWAREQGLDTFIDEMVESYVDYGASLIKKVKGARPEVVPLQSLAFGDQTDLLSGPFAILHQFSPEQLREVGKLNGWENIEEAITLAENVKSKERDQKVQTPGKYIEVFEVHGTFPSSWLEDKYAYNEEDEKYEDYIPQLHICTFYQKEGEEKKGMWLFRGTERELPFKLVLRDKVFGRCFGIGGAEELFEAQVWANYDIIRIRDLLDAASKIVFQTDDPKFANRNKLHSMQNLEIAVIDEGKSIAQIDTQPRNMGLFERSIVDWEQHARIMGAATESILGESPTAGTPFKLQELITAESHSLHEYRKGKLAIFLDEVYMDWIVPELVKRISKGDEFLAEFDPEELDFIAEQVSQNSVSDAVKSSALRGQPLHPEAIKEVQARTRAEFMKGGHKRFVEILEGEMKDAPIAVKANIVGKQKDLAGKVDKLVNVLRFMLSTYYPNTRTFAVFNDPRMLRLFRQILESSGLDQAGFSEFQPQVQAEPPSVSSTAVLQNLAKTRSLAGAIAQ